MSIIFYSPDVEFLCTRRLPTIPKFAENREEFFCMVVLIHKCDWKKMGQISHNVIFNPYYSVFTTF